VNIYIIGFMGCGKSTVGKKLATKLGWPFRDTDLMVEGAMGMSVPEIFNSLGEDVFRKKEKEMVEELCQQTNLVVACGGGVPCYENNLQLLKQSGVVVYLKMTPEAIINRLKTAKSERPLLKNLSGDQLVDKIVFLLDKRSQFYGQAHFVINGINVNLNGLVEKINKHLSGNK
jgi:shikimate kinase